MKLPEELQFRLAEISNKYKVNDLMNAYSEISKRYMSEKRTGNTLLSSEIDVVAYANARMPATYGAVHAAFSKVDGYINEKDLRTLIDIGAGTGAATWAISDFINFEKITCIEKEKNMMNLGKELMEYTKFGRLNGLEYTRYK